MEAVFSSVFCEYGKNHLGWNPVREEGCDK
jgi:hypothetical protein